MLFSIFRRFSAVFSQEIRQVRYVSFQWLVPAQMRSKHSAASMEYCPFRVTSPSVSMPTSLPPSRTGSRLTCSAAISPAARES